MRITARLGQDGTMTLDRRRPAGRHRGRPRGRFRGSRGKTFCLGHDNGQPVAAYSKGKPFQGKIIDLKVTVP